MTVAVAMSGGVDSSVAALLLVRAGHRVVGLHMHLYGVCRGLAADMTRSCCSPADEAVARRVAAAIGIPFLVVDLSARFRAAVIEPFARAYATGRTPSPCVACNHDLKFAALLDRATAMGADAVATGHYARIADRGGSPAIARPADRRKDQSYFLYGVAPDALSRTLLPLADLTKPEVRALAAEAGLPVADKPESQDVCFLAGEPYWAWLARQGFLKDPDPGDVTDRAGRVLGRHPGVHRFTVGQRQGFGRSYGGRTYVIAIDAVAKRVVVGGRDDLLSAGFAADDCRWQGGLTPDRPFEAVVLVRYRDRGRPGRVTPCLDGTARVETAEPVSAVTPGQAAVFYVDDVVVGGGTIS